MLLSSDFFLKGLSQCDLAAHRAILDGLVIPALMDFPDFWLGLDACRAGYGTRLAPGQTSVEGLIAATNKVAAEGQTQRGTRCRNKDWATGRHLVEPALKACLLWWAGLQGGGIQAPHFDDLCQFLGLDVTAHRRMAMLRTLEAEGYLRQERSRVFRLVGPPEALATRLCPWWRLFYGLNILTPAIFQRFRQVEGSMLAAWHFRIAPEQVAQIHQNLTTLIVESLSRLARPLREVKSAERGEHLLVGNFCATVPAPLSGRVEYGDGLTLALMGPGGEALRQLAPWNVVAAILRRRFVEMTSERTGLKGVALYDHIATRYRVRSANTVRSFMNAPTLEGPGAENTFNRGRILEMAYAIRCVLAELGSSRIPEVSLRERVGRSKGGDVLDPVYWRSAIHLLEEEDIIARSPVSSMVWARAQVGGERVRPDMEKVEAAAKQLLPRFLSMAQVMAGKSDESHADVHQWVIPRSALVSVRERIYEMINSYVHQFREPLLEMDEVEEQKLGLVATDFFLVARTRPLLR